MQPGPSSFARAKQSFQPINSYGFVAARNLVLGSRRTLYRVHPVLIGRVYSFLSPHPVAFSLICARVKWLSWSWRKSHGKRYDDDDVAGHTSSIDFLDKHQTDVYLSLSFLIVIKLQSMTWLTCLLMGIYIAPIIAWSWWYSHHQREQLCPLMMAYVWQKLRGILIASCAAFTMQQNMRGNKCRTSRAWIFWWISKHSSSNQVAGNAESTHWSLQGWTWTRNVVNVLGGVMIIVEQFLASVEIFSQHWGSILIEMVQTLSQLCKTNHYSWLFDLSLVYWKF